MSFLDNLENSLKNLESQDERDPNAQQRRSNERARSAAVAPWSEKLKNSAFTQQLFERAATTGHRLRTKIYMAWMDGSLRLEARERKLELRPTAAGIQAHFIEPDRAESVEDLKLEGDPQALLDRWLQPDSETKEEK